MRTPNFQGEEKKLYKLGYKRVAGLDEAGRGPLSGPVVAAAAMVKNWKLKSRNLKVNDSKKLSPKQREEIYRFVAKDHNFAWGIGVVSEKVIDKINILQATKLAMVKAVNNLEKKLQKRLVKKSCDRRIFRQIDFLILDGNIKLNLPIPQRAIIKADEKVFSCAAASIIAKVTRDKIMEKYHKKYPEYNFKKHKGYPTKLHFKLLKKYGPCRIHRKTFGPVRTLAFKNR